MFPVGVQVLNNGVGRARVPLLAQWCGLSRDRINLERKYIDIEEYRWQNGTMRGQEVHGLTTAASVWLAAAVEVAVGGGRRLHIVSVYVVMLVILVLRFGPQLYFTQDAESQQDFNDVVDDDSALDWDSITDDSSTGLSIDDENEDVEDLEKTRVYNIGKWQ